MRRDGIPEEDIRMILAGPGRKPKEEEVPGPYPTLQELTPEELEADLRASLKAKGVAPRDIDNMVEGFLKRRSGPSNR